MLGKCYLYWNRAQLSVTPTYPHEIGRFDAIFDEVWLWLRHVVHAGVGRQRRVSGEAPDQRCGTVRGDGGWAENKGWDIIEIVRQLLKSERILGLRPSNEMVLLCNDVSHWMGASLESTLEMSTTVLNISQSRHKPSICFGYVSLKLFWIVRRKQCFLPTIQNSFEETYWWFSIRLWKLYC